MEIEEVEQIILAQNEIYKNEWEQTRIISYYAASGFNKLPELKKFLPFEWDNEVSEKAHKSNRKPSKTRMDNIINSINKSKENVKL